MKRKVSPVKRFSNRVVVHLTNGQMAIVSLEDEEKVRGLRWHQTPKGYANAYVKALVPKGSTTKTFMHRLLMPTVPEGHCVDHINHNKLDNRRENLRIVPLAFNSFHRQASNKETGIYFRTRKRDAKKPWQAHFRGKWIGRFSTKEEAINFRQSFVEMAYREVK